MPYCPSQRFILGFTERREEEDFEEKKALKKKIKELKFLDSKIAQNLCKYQVLMLLNWQKHIGGGFFKLFHFLYDFLNCMFF